ncbi:MAG: chemotaxis protein CheW [Tissierellaceae bacterium]
MSSAIDNKYVTFKLNKEFYGFPIDKVISIERMQKFTRIPNGPTHLKGVINLRGEVIPLIDLRQKLDMELKEIDNNSRIIIVTEDDIVAGLIVDSSSEVMEIDSGNIDIMSTTENDDATCVSGIGKIENRLIILLELSKLLEN